MLTAVPPSRYFRRNGTLYIVAQSGSRAGVGAMVRVTVAMQGVMVNVVRDMATAVSDDESCKANGYGGE